MSDRRARLSRWIGVAAWWVLSSCAAHAQWPAQLQMVNAISTPEDDVVIGSDGQNLIVLTRPAGAEDWRSGSTRIARITTSPWTTEPSEPWGLVPNPEPAWQGLGTLVHVDIDPQSDMAVISALREGQHSVWLSGRQPDGTWARPWPLPGLVGGAVEATFAMFDPAPERGGDLLLAIRPPSREAEATLPNRRGQWKGGWDVARIPRRGNYGAIWFMDDLNTTANEWALAPHPVQGGWLSTERMSGRGGVDAWWCPDIPVAEEVASPEKALVAHTLTVECAGTPMAWVSWQVVDLESGAVVDEVITDQDGVARLDRLVEGARYQWSATPPEGVDCPKATAVWRDGEGQVVQRFSLFDGAWVLNMLTALDIGAWRVRALDRSRLPQPSEPAITADIARGAAAWVVFHPLGSAALDGPDAMRVKAWAQSWKQEAEGMLLVLGHASRDGDPVANRRLAEERARQVAVHLEFAGIPADRIRVEGRGSDQPLLRCPEGVDCPEEAMARSRRTELFPIRLQRP